MIRCEEVLDHRYVVCVIDSNCKEFEISMFVNNDIEGFIKPELWHVNGITEYHFDITGKKSFCDMLEEGVVGDNELKLLFSGLAVALDSAGEYLISRRVIMLEPEFIYFSDCRVEFIFDMYGDKDLKSALLSLIKHIQNKLDYSDRSAAEKIYQIFDIVAIGTGDIHQITDMFKDSYCVNEKRMDCRDICSISEKHVEDDAECSNVGCCESSTKLKYDSVNNIRYNSVLTILMFVVIVVLAFIIVLCLANRFMMGAATAGSIGIVVIFTVACLLLSADNKRDRLDRDNI